MKLIGVFWESFGKALVERWMDVALPALFFWCVGAISLGYFYGLQEVDSLLTELTNWQVFSMGVLGLMSFFSSMLFVYLLVYPTRKILEGQWPKLIWLLHRLTTHLKYRKVQKAEIRWQELVTKDGLSTQEKYELKKLELFLHKTPSREIGPTELGNIQRAVEIFVRDKYGLAVDITLPRLKLLLPDAVKKELESLSNSTNLFVLWFLWGILTSVWSIWATWVLALSLMLAIIAYRSAVFTATKYALTVESCYDLYRFSLYKALRLPLPDSAEHEKQIGEQVNCYLWRGIMSRDVKFT